MLSEKEKRIQKWSSKICNINDRMYKYDGYDCKGRGVDGKKRPSGALTILQHNKYIKKNMYGNCRCSEKKGHSCGWVILLDSAIDKSIVSRSWPIRYGIYNYVTHQLMQDYILPDYTYNLIEFENVHNNINLNQVMSELNQNNIYIFDNPNLNINSLINKLLKYEESLKIKEKYINKILQNLCKRELENYFKKNSEYESDL